MERGILAEAMPGSVVGSPDTVKAGVKAFIEKSAADELMITGPIYDHALRLRSYEIAANVRDAL